MRRNPSRPMILIAFCISAVPAHAGFVAQRTYAGPPLPRAPASTVPMPRQPVAVDVISTGAIGPGLGEARDRIRAAREAGLITRREARQLKREAGVIARHAEVYGRDGLSDSERNELETRTLYLLDAVQPPPAPAVGAK